MVQNSRNELYNLSNQMIDLFIKDVFSKNKTDLEKAKSNITDEQRDTLKKSVHHLQEQVESFIYEQNASKTITEKNQTANDAATSPLRKKLSKAKPSGDIGVNKEEDQEE